MNEDLAMALEALRTKHASILDINERIALRVAANWLISQTESEDNEWITWNGTASHPDLPPETKVDVVINGNVIEDCNVRWWTDGADLNNWNHTDQANRITTYRVVK